VKLVRTFFLGAIAAACLCRCALPGEPTLAPPPPRPQPVAPLDTEKSSAPVFVSARSIRVVAPLDKIDALLRSLAGKNATGTNILIHCDKTEIVPPGSDSVPEIECFGDVIVRGKDYSVQAERVVKRGNTLIFEGTSGKPVQIVRQRKGKPDVHLTANEVSFDLAAGRVALTVFRAMETKESLPKGP